MRTAVVGVLMVAGLTTAALAVRPDGSRASGERTEFYRPNASERRLVVCTSTVGDKYELLTIVDPERSVILVYHVELASGDVELRCVRNIESDLQLDYYNGKSPLPSEIRSQLGFR